MTLDKFTIKAQEAVQQAVNTAQLNGQQVIEPVHILKGVLEKSRRSSICRRCKAVSPISLTIVTMYSCVRRRQPRRWAMSL